MGEILMFESIIGTVVAILGFFGVSFVIEKTPIKINPLSIIKKFLVGDLSEKIDTIGKRVDENEKDRIYRFSECYCGNCSCISTYKWVFLGV